MSSNKIHPCLWFENQASEAADFYCSVFQSGEVIARTELVTIFELDGNKFMTINGFPMLLRLFRWLRGGRGDGNRHSTLHAHRVPVLTASIPFRTFPDDSYTRLAGSVP